MSQWVNRTVLSGSSTAQNGTNSHTCTFTPATANNLLVAIVAGSTAFTTPANWTLRQSAVNWAGLYVYTKIAFTNESSFTTSHDNPNYPIEGVIYEFAAGTTYQAGNSVTGQVYGSSVTTPVVSSLTGSTTRFSARALDLGPGTASAACAWTNPSTEDYDAYITATPEAGIYLTIAYADTVSGATFTPSSNITATGTNLTSDGEGISFVLNVVPPAVTSEQFNTAEGGTNGTGATTGNTGGGSGDAFGTVTVGTGSITFDNTQVYNGALAYNITAGSGSRANVIFSTPSMAVAVRAYVYLTANPTVSTQLISILGSSTTACNLSISAAGLMYMQDVSGTIFNSRATVPLNTWLRLELMAMAGSTTTTGFASGEIYLGDSITSPIYSYISNHASTTVGPMISTACGKASTTGNWATMYVDDMYTNNTLTLPSLNFTTSAWVGA